MGVVGRGYTATVYAKAGTNDIIRIANVSSASNGCWYNLTSGAVGTSNGAAILRLLKMLETVGIDLQDTLTVSCWWKPSGYR